MIEDYEMSSDLLENSTVFQYFKDQQLQFTLQQIENTNSATIQEDLLENNKYKIVSTTNGYFIICNENKSIFYMNADNTINTWAKYKYY